MTLTKKCLLSISAFVPSCKAKNRIVVINLSIVVIHIKNNLCTPSKVKLK